MVALPRVPKVSPRRQVTLPEDVHQYIGRISYIEVATVKGDLMLRRADSMSLEEIERAWGKHGIGRDVLVQALRIVNRKKGGG